MGFTEVVSWRYSMVIGYTITRIVGKPTGDVIQPFVLKASLTYTILKEDFYKYFLCHIGMDSHRWLDRQVDTQTDRQRDRHTNRQTGKKTGRQIGRKTDRQTHRQTHR